MQNIKVLADEIANSIWKMSDRVELTQILEELLCAKGYSLEDSSVIDNFDKLKRAVSKKLTRKIEEASAKGLKPRYIFAGFDSDYLTPLSDSAEDKVRDEVIEAIKALSWRAFEHFSAHILAINGVKSSTARGTKEEGIDIFGLLNLRDISRSTLWHDATVRVAGQAKKGKISEQIVRLFSTDLNSLREKKGRAYEQSPDWFKASVAPIIGIIFTSNNVAQTATTWADRKGILTRDIWQMVEDLLRTKDSTLGFVQTDNQLFFDRAEFIGHFERKR